jgi:hypothetical protein
MSYIINGARPHALTIGGTNYTSRLVNFTVSDGSAFKNGFVTTSGTVTLATTNDGTNLADYDRNMFKRGAVVLLDITYDDGTTERHPRGYLYVIGVSYDIENEQINIEVGCELTLRRLINKVDDILTLAPITLDPERKTYEGISGSLATAGKYAYQNNQGTIVTTDSFPSQNEFFVDNNVYISVRGTTAVDVNPLQSGPAPDEIIFEAAEPTAGENTSGQGMEDVVTTTSYYFIKHPGPLFKQVRSCSEVQECLGDLKNSTPDNQLPPVVPNSCGRDPETPPEAGYSKCEDMYEVIENRIYLPARSTQIQTTTYGGPAAQVSEVVTETYKFALELNPGFFSDVFYACWANFGTYCNPNGYCRIGGLHSILAERRIQKNIFGEANEVVETQNFVYSNSLAVVKPEDYRSGTVDGVPQIFTASVPARLFLAEYTRILNYSEDNLEVQETITKTSPTSRGIGVSKGLYYIDAIQNGITTRQIRKSTKATVLNIAPDNANNSATITQNSKTTIELENGGKEGPSWHEKYIAEESGLVPFLIDNKEARQAAIRKYENYLKYWYEGDARGIQITEMLRKTIATNWYPTRTFRYYDPNTPYYAAFRMDASSWEVTPAGCYVATDGLFIDEFSGAPTIPNNVVGAATPDMTDGAPTTPSAPNPEPTDNDPDFSNPKNMKIRCTLELGFSVKARYGGLVPPPITRADADLNFIMKIYVSGILSQVGALVLPTELGNLPITSGQRLIVDDSKIIDQDLFA